LNARVSWIAVAPVKSLALAEIEEAELGRDGIRGDRRFFLVDESGRMTNNKRHGVLQQVVPAWDEAANTLTLRFPDGTELSGPAGPGVRRQARFYRDTLEVEEVPGGFGDALSDLAGAPIRLVAHTRPGGGGDRGIPGATSLLSTGSLARLAHELGVESLDPRRFRMHFGVDGVEAHAEDGWLGRRVRLGEAVVVPRGLVGRCAVTSQDPATGRPNLDTLKALTRYRSNVPSREPLPFGVFAEVVEPGRVALGDTVEPL
jgi:uncharacterized protein YcbX